MLDFIKLLFIKEQCEFKLEFSKWLFIIIVNLTEYRFRQESNTITFIVRNTLDTFLSIKLINLPSFIN